MLHTTILHSAPLKSQKTVIFLSCVFFAVLQLQTLRQEMQQLEVYDSMEVIKREKANQRLIKDLELCQRSNQSTVQPTEPPPGTPQTSTTLASSKIHSPLSSAFSVLLCPQVSVLMVVF